MIQELKMYGCDCDGCGKMWQNYDGIMGYMESRNISDSIKDDDWYITVDNKTYCPDCWSTDDEDNLVLKTKTPTNEPTI